MGQVPTNNPPSYALIGSGRLAIHLQKYFLLQGIKVQSWSRSQNQSALIELIANSTHVLLAIRDNAIADFHQTYLNYLSPKIVIHFSGALSIENMESAHPLMTFGPHSDFVLSDYRRIPFVLERGKRPFSELFPQLPNPSFYIPSNKKSFYHALCVCSGNFTTLLWQRTMVDFTQTLNLPAEILNPYLERIAENLKSAPRAESSGPISRRDTLTINKNLKALEGHPFKAIYEGFLQMVTS